MMVIFQIYVYLKHIYYDLCLAKISSRFMFVCWLVRLKRIEKKLWNLKMLSFHRTIIEIQ